MIDIEIRIKRPDGFHARPASELVKIASKYKSSIYIKRNGKTMSAKSILGLMSLALNCGEVIELVIDGEDEQEALNNIINIF